MINDQLATVRCYKRAEVAEILNIPETWLKLWVTARFIPHQRSGNPNGKQQRGVWFTWTDILAIGDMLPELMTVRRAKKAAGANADPSALGAPKAITADLLDQWASIGLG